jgi:hypothetical protein
MSKKQNSMRHVIKMAERRKQKAAKAAFYASLAGRDSNSKRKGMQNTKPVSRKRDIRCKNIGDFLAFPEQVGTSLARFTRGKNQYGGKYKHQMAYERLKAYIGFLDKPTNRMETWLDEPVRNHLNQIITRRSLVVVR